MNVNDLNKNIIKVSFSDLSEYDNWDPIFWISMNQYINQYKALGKDKAVEFVAERVKKMGIENYNALKNISDKNHFGVPEFKNAIDVKKLTLIGSTKIIVLMDLIQSKSKIRKQELEKQLKELQNKIALLDESVEIYDGVNTPSISELKNDIKNGNAFLKKDNIVKSLKNVSGKFRLFSNGVVDPYQYTYDEILYLIRREKWSYANDDGIKSMKTARNFNKSNDDLFKVLKQKRFKEYKGEGSPDFKGKQWTNEKLVVSIPDKNKDEYKAFFRDFDEKNGTTLKTIKTLEDFEELVGEKNLKGVLQVLKRLG